MEFKFEKPIIWQKAMDLGRQINIIVYNFTKTELFNLSSQIRRVADSIAFNISEGSMRQSNPDFKRFMTYFNSLIRQNNYLFTQSEKKGIYF